MNNETRNRKKQTRLLPRELQWLFLGVVLGIYLDRTFKLIESLDVAPSTLSISDVPDASPSRQSVLPKRLISVFGSESSGSTFLATTLGIASGAFPINGTRVTLPSDKFNNPGRTIVQRTIAKRARSPDGATEIQHLSLPWGYWGSKKRNCELAHQTLTVEALVPEPCFRFDYEETWEHRLAERAPASCKEEAHITGKDGAAGGWSCGTSNCGQGENDGYALYPRRFFVNITSHVEWYLRRGVDVTAVLSVRDRTISREGKTRLHCANASVALEEEERARSIMSESLRRYGMPSRSSESGFSHDNSNKARVVVVSYEALMAMQEPYLLDTYKMLGIESDHVPAFKDGNEKYVKTT